MTSPLYKYTMVGQLTTPPFQSVYWLVYNAPDTTGLNSGYFGQLQNISVASTEQVTYPTNSTPVLDANSLNGIPIANSVPVNNQVLVYDSTSNSYVPGNAALLTLFIATLRTTLPASIQTTISISGFSASGDGGGGTFVWTATGPLSTASDDGGTILEVGGVPVGRWVRVFSGPFNVLWWGADPTGVNDSTTAIQAAINAGIATGVCATVYLSHGTYKITSTLNIIGTQGTQVAVNLVGDSGGTAGGTTVKWYGASLQPMLIRQWVNQCFDRDIFWDGSLTALCCNWQKPHSTWLHYDRCLYYNVKQVNVWSGGMSVSIGTTVLTPATSSAYADNGHLYTCTNAGSGTTAGSATTFPTTNGASSTADANGVVWTESGPSPATFLVGAFVFPGGDTQAADTHWNSCQFYGGASLGKAAGWRSLGAGNIKDFFLPSCSFGGSSVGLDWNYASGFLSASGSEFFDNALDMRQSGGSMHVTGWGSEGSSMLLFGNLGGSTFAHCSLTDGNWIGTTVGATGTAMVKYGGKLTLIGNYFQDQNASNPYPYVVLNVNGTTVMPSLFSEGNVYLAAAAYAGTMFLPLYGTGGSSLTPGSPDYGSFLDGQTINYVSMNDIMQPSNGTPHRLPSVTGQQAELVGALTIANGDNDNLPLGGFLSYIATGATGAVNLKGFISGVAGQRIRIKFNFSQQITVKNNSSADVPILTPTGADVIYAAQGAFLVLDFWSDGTNWNLVDGKALT